MTYSVTFHNPQGLRLTLTGLSIGGTIYAADIPSLELIANTHSEHHTHAPWTYFSSKRDS